MVTKRIKKNTVALVLLIISCLNNLEAQTWSGLTPGDIFYNQGKVGIGTNTPRQLLTISDLDAPVLRFNRSGTKHDWEIYTISGGSLFFRGGADGVGSSLTNRLTIQSDGNIGIGIDNPTQKLQVAGTVYSTEVKVEIAAGQGPDYVFESDYELRTLKEIKEYITENKHLPEIPSAKKMEANGVKIGDMNMRLLKKIEELTLYQIELLERLEKLETKNARIDELEKKIELLNKN